MDKLKLFIGVGICGVIFSGCELFSPITSIGSDVQDMWSGKKEEKGKTEEKDCVPSDFKARVAKYKEQYKNDDDMYPKVANMDRTPMFNQQETYSSYNARCSTYMAKAYDEIIKEDGAPKNYDEEMKFLDKVKKRFTRLFKLDNPNSLYECELGKCDKKK